MTSILSGPGVEEEGMPQYGKVSATLQGMLGAPGTKSTEHLRGGKRRGK
jgi:hypothetical protein